MHGIHVHHLSQPNRSSWFAFASDSLCPFEIVIFRHIRNWNEQCNCTLIIGKLMFQCGTMQHRKPHIRMHTYDTAHRWNDIEIQSLFIWLIFIPFFPLRMCFFTKHTHFYGNSVYSTWRRSENVLQRYRLCVRRVPVYRVKEIFCVQFYISANPFVIFAHLFSNLCWSLVMINLRLPIAMCEKHGDNQQQPHRVPTNQATNNHWHTQFRKCAHDPQYFRVIS